MGNLANISAGSASKLASWTTAFYFIGFILLLQFVLHLRQVFRSDLKGIPGPTIARLTAFWRPWALRNGDCPEVYYDLHRKYGTFVRVAPGVVSIADPKAIPQIYGIGSKFIKSKFYNIFDVAYKDSFMPSMFSVREPAQHQALRRPVAQKFSMSAIKTMEPFADDAIDIFLEAMKELEGQKVDFGTWLQWYAFDVISAMTFHRRFGFMEERRDIENMIGDISVGLMPAATIGQVPELHPWLLGSKWLPKLLATQPFIRVPDPLRTVVKFTEDCIEEYDLNPPTADRPDLMGWLRQVNAKGESMSYADMVNHLSNNLLAGSDTTAISLRAVIYYLVKNPECFKKAQAEVDEADQAAQLSEHISYAECLQLPYLQAVMKEAMRCHPGVSYPLERIVPAGGQVICGHYFNEGTIVGMNAVVMHRDTSIFGDDALEFRPERWLDPDEERVKNMDRHLMTFGYGSRTCIGKNISIMEMGKLVPTILPHFELEWASDEPNWRVYSFWFARQEGLILRLKSRSKN